MTYSLGFSTPLMIPIVLKVGTSPCSLDVATTLIIGFLLQISLSNYVILIATIMSVLILEILNTSIESIVDLVVKKEFSSLAKISKDTSAGAVLLASINSVIIAVYIFVPKIKLLFESI